MNGINRQIKTLIALAVTLILAAGPLLVLAIADADQEGFVDEQPCIDARCQQTKPACTDGQCLKDRREEAKKECELEQQQEEEPPPQPPPQIDSVPVKEVGELLTLTKNIDKNTTEIRQLTTDLKNLQIEICTHLKVIRDMNLAMEEKEFKFDPDARKFAAQVTHGHFKATLNDMRAGYEVGKDATGVQDDAGKNKQLLQPANVPQHLGDVYEETFGVFKDDLANETKLPAEKAPFRQEVLEAIESEVEGDPLAIFQASPGWTRERFDKAVKGESEDFWEDFLYISQPQNNPYGAYLLAGADFSARAGSALKTAQNELLAGQGFLPTRRCAVWTQDGKTCRQWVTLTTGSVIKDYIVGVALSFIDQVVQSGENLENFISQELPNILKQILNLKEGQPGSIFDQPDEYVGPGPSPEKSGWQAGQKEAERQIQESQEDGSGDGSNYDSPDFRDGLQGALEGGTDWQQGLSEDAADDIIDRIMGTGGTGGLPEALSQAVGAGNFELQSIITDYLQGALQGSQQEGNITEEQMPSLLELLLRLIINFIFSFFG